MSALPSRTTMAKEKSWFVGFTRREVDKTSKSAAAAAEKKGEEEEMDLLADQVQTGAVLSGIDPEQEREPPRRPLTITMPSVETAHPVAWSNAHPPPDFQMLFASIQGEEVVLSRHVQALNFFRLAPQEGGRLFPERADGSPYIKSAEDAEKSFADRIGELNISNDVAFRALSKTTKPGQQAPRLAHLRAFWIGLDNMAQYWTSPHDTSAETYIEREGESPKYKGRRIANGSEMPDSYRADTVRALVEAAASAFQCRVSAPHITPPRLTPVLQVGRLEQPVRLTGVVSRLPADTEKARARILEGPIMGILERNTISFVSGAKKVSVLSDRKSIHDALREAAALLLIAQERRREGKPVQDPAEGKWWSTRPRWGGGPGGKLPLMQKHEDVMAEVQARLDNTESPSDELKKEASEAKRRLRQAHKTVEKWNAMTSQPAVWDSKTDYKAIGKEPGSDYDEIYLVSCLYHHVSFLKLTVHGAYVDYLTTGIMPDPLPSDEYWCQPILQRTDWMDLLHQPDRVSAFSTTWAILEYMTRQTDAAKTTAEDTGEATVAQTGGEKADIGKTLDAQTAQDAPTTTTTAEDKGKATVAQADAENIRAVPATQTAQNAATTTTSTTAFAGGTGKATVTQNIEKPPATQTAGHAASATIPGNDKETTTSTTRSVCSDDDTTAQTGGPGTIKTNTKRDAGTQTSLENTGDTSTIEHIDENTTPTIQTRVAGQAAQSQTDADRPSSTIESGLQDTAATQSAADSSAEAMDTND